MSGLGPTILRKVKGVLPPLDSNAFAWTGCPQSFMDTPGSGSYTCENTGYILRQDIWRLLHLPATENNDLHFRHRPFAPWAPCGVSLTKNCALRVASHLECDRHEYQYDHWNWELEGGFLIKDYGHSRDFATSKLNNSCRTPSSEILLFFEEKKLDIEQEASREASVDIFGWLFMNGRDDPLKKFTKMIGLEKHGTKKRAFMKLTKPMREIRENLIVKSRIEFSHGSTQFLSRILTNQMREFLIHRCDRYSHVDP